MKIISILLISIFLSTPAYALFGLFQKNDYQLAKVGIKENTTKIESLAKIVSDISIKVNSNMQAGANLNAQLGLINKTLNNTVNAGGDANNIVNDIDMDIVIKYGCWVLIGSLLFNFIQILMVIRQFGRTADFKRSYKDSQEFIKRKLP